MRHIIHFHSCPYVTYLSRFALRRILDLHGLSPTPSSKGREPCNPTGVSPGQPARSSFSHSRLRAAGATLSRGRVESKDHLARKVRLAQPAAMARMVQEGRRARRAAMVQSLRSAARGSVHGSKRYARLRRLPTVRVPSRPTHERHSLTSSAVRPVPSYVPPTASLVACQSAGREPLPRAFVIHSARRKSPTSQRRIRSARPASCCPRRCTLPSRRQIRCVVERAS